MRNTIIVGGGLALLFVVGGVMNNWREEASACADQQYIDYVRPSMVAEFTKKSIYFSALQAAVESPRLDDAQRDGYEDELIAMNEALEGAVVDAREVSPSSKGSLTCDYTLTVYDNPGLQSDTSIRARFRLELEDIPGTDFEKKYNKRQRNIIILQPLVAGEPVETVRIAELGRRSFVINEPSFRGARYDQTFVPEEAVPTGVLSEIPK